ncbi:MAG: 30S ribosome-binding factor RbfA [Ignavibacteriae bacterium]|nr:30S ribosome-binding factor RbfA [Ignavibacteriota bacterium]
MSHRPEKVAEEIKHKLNSAMSKDLMELHIGLVTISKVMMTPDLRIAKVYVTFLGNREPVEKCLDRINFRKKHIRFLLAKHLNMKYIPELNFYYDDTLDYADKINKLLNEVRKEENKSE